MKKSEFIKKFNLEPLQLIANFKDGRTWQHRRLYCTRGTDNCYVFFDHDLCIFKKYPHESVTRALACHEINGRIVACYSWYHSTN